jgi:hypothetical protein
VSTIGEPPPDAGTVEPGGPIVVCAFTALGAVGNPGPDTGAIVIGGGNATCVTPDFPIGATGAVVVGGR